jgi:flagellum-specific peptidoglycan hydrolase FlgJ
MNGSVRRYLMVEKCADYKSTIKLITAGGYATDVKYVDKICSIIERFGLDRYDAECIAKRKDAPAAGLPYSVRVLEPINIKSGPKAS